MIMLSTLLSNPTFYNNCTSFATGDRVNEGNYESLWEKSWRAPRFVVPLVEALPITVKKTFEHIFLCLNCWSSALSSLSHELDEGCGPLTRSFETPTSQENHLRKTSGKLGRFWKRETNGANILMVVSLSRLANWWLSVNCLTFFLLFVDSFLEAVNVFEICILQKQHGQHSCSDVQVKSFWFTIVMTGRIASECNRF